MKQIGFKNFRKFENFPTMDLGDITIIVGGNNAGKSTVVKALLLINDFLKTSIFINEEDDKIVLNNRFYFDKTYYAHIGTVSRAICNSTNNKELSFYANFGDCSINITLFQDDESKNATNAFVRELELKDLNRGIDYLIDFTKNSLIAKFQPKSLEEQPNGERTKVEVELKDLRMQKRKEKDLAKKVELSDRIRDLNSYLRYIKKQNKAVLEPRIIRTTITGYRPMIGGPLLNLLLYRLVGLEEFFDSNGELKPNKKDTNKDFNLTKEDISFLVKYGDPLRSSIGMFDGFGAYMRQYEYIYAHSANQMIIYNSKDSNDYLVKTIHEFANMRIKAGEAANRFIKEWMKEFEIGTDYDLQSVGGEAHTLEIIDENRNRVFLADKGMGSIQLMVLLLRLATLIGNKKNAIRRNGLMIMVEEPEQNLHPKLQSKLVDLFVYLNKKYGFKFIIETHSEYLVRKSQVIVGDQNYKSIEELKDNNPFKVYYFPENGEPYEMEYTPSGLFNNDFDPGFFDEATRHQLKLLQNKRRNNNV